MKIVFMGTPGFAVPSLNILVSSGYEITGVVTVPDKPAGRGQHVRISPVKEYALKHSLKVFQPANLKDPEFIKELKSLSPDLFIVVAFRMLPEVIWKMPPFGTFNLHASLLPQYRGAAPINWAIINGEKETGVTTFFINETIDTGKILFTERINIGDDETAGELHDRLMTLGASLVLKTVKAIGNGNIIPQDQQLFEMAELRTAPKIFKEDCRIDWEQNVTNVCNLIRGLSPYPAAFTNLISTNGDQFNIKIFKAKALDLFENKPGLAELIPGTISTDQLTYLHVACKDGFISIDELQLEGKRRITIKEFLRGFRMEINWRML
jgi:methionyl-tRNA formyltransferase